MTVQAGEDGSNRYYLDGSLDAKMLLPNTTYVLTGVPEAHPLAILGALPYAGDNKLTKDVAGSPAA